MERFFKMSRNPAAKPGCPGYQVVDQEGGKPSGAALQRLAEELAWLAQDTKDREAAARLKSGMYYCYRTKSGIKYIKYVGIDEVGVLCVFVDKRGQQIDEGAGVGAVTYLQHSPVSRLTMLKMQPEAAMPA